MDSLPSYRVERTREVTGGSAQMVQLRELFAPDRMAAEMKRTTLTTWTPDLLFATADEDREHLVQRGHRVIARLGEDGEWFLRKQRFALGARAPQPLDPTILFDVLREMDLNIQAGAGSKDDTETFTLTLIPEQAGDLVWSGALPHIDDVFLKGAANTKQDQDGAPKIAQWPQGKFALCITANKKTRLVHDIRARIVEQDNVVVTIDAGEGDGPVGVEPQANENLAETFDRFRSGLPATDTKGHIVTLYTWTFSEHGAARPMKLNERAKRLLRMTR